jgi:hypothetical protein
VGRKKRRNFQVKREEKVEDRHVCLRGKRTVKEK